MTVPLTLWGFLVSRHQAYCSMFLFFIMRPLIWRVFGGASGAKQIALFISVLGSRSQLPGNLSRQWAPSKIPFLSLIVGSTYLTKSFVHLKPSIFFSLLDVESAYQDMHSGNTAPRRFPFLSFMTGRFSLPGKALWELMASRLPFLFCLRSWGSTLPTILSRCSDLSRLFFVSLTFGFLDEGF